MCNTLIWLCARDGWPCFLQFVSPRCESSVLENNEMKHNDGSHQRLLSNRRHWHLVWFYLTSLP